MKNTPKLRFKGFEGEWEEKKLGEVMESYSGGTPSVSVKKYYDGDIPFIRSGEIHSDKTQLFITEEGLNNSSAKMVSKGTLLYALYGATSGDVAIAKIDGAINQAVLAINPQPQYDSIFLENYLLKNKQSIIDTFLQGGQGNLSGQIVKNVDLIHPSLPEQRKLSSYFTHLDTLIESSRQKVEKLKQVKAASLQSFFPAHGQRTPNVRFKGCEGEWKVVKLNSFAKRVVRKNTHLESTLALTIASAHGLISQKDYFNNSVVGANIRNYYLLKKGEFAYNKSYSNGFPFGSVKRLDNYEQGILSTLYIVFSIDDSIDSDYLCHFFDTSLWHNDVAERATEGARNHGLLNIGAEDFLDIDIILPNSLPEQRKIASYFTHLDTLLTLERQRYEKLQQVKRASLSQMLV